MQQPNPLTYTGIPKQDYQQILQSKGPEELRRILKQYCRQTSLIFHADHLGIDTLQQRRLNELSDFINNTAFSSNIQQKIDSLRSIDENQESGPELRKLQEQLNMLEQGLEQVLEQRDKLQRECQGLHEEYKALQEEYKEVRFENAMYNVNGKAAEARRTKSNAVV